MHEISEEELHIASSLLVKFPNDDQLKTIQKKMKIGYVKAKNIIEILEIRGII